MRGLGRSGEQPLTELLFDAGLQTEPCSLTDGLRCLGWPGDLRSKPVLGQTRRKERPGVKAADPRTMGIANNSIRRLGRSLALQWTKTPKLLEHAELVLRVRKHPTCAAGPQRQP